MGTVIDDEKSCYVASFNEQVTQDLLEELFTQVGPVTKVIIKTINNSDSRFALIEFEDEESVLFAIETLDGIKLYNTPISVKPRNRTNQEENYRRAKPEIERRQRSNPVPKQRESRYSNSHQPPQPYAIPNRYSNYQDHNSHYSTPQNHRNSYNHPGARQMSAPGHRNDYTPRRQQYQGGDYQRRDERGGGDRGWRQEHHNDRSYSQSQDRRSGGGGYGRNQGSFSNRR